MTLTFPVKKPLSQKRVVDRMATSILAYMLAGDRMPWREKWDCDAHTFRILQALVTGFATRIDCKVYDRWQGEVCHTGSVLRYGVDAALPTLKSDRLEGLQSCTAILHATRCGICRQRHRGLASSEADLNTQDTCSCCCDKTERLLVLPSTIRLDRENAVAKHPHVLVRGSGCCLHVYR
jgi:hypothetical protein